MNPCPTATIEPPPKGSPPLEPHLWEALRQVIDPEIGVNIVDLGLIYSLRIESDVVTVIMTVTTPGCPMEHSLVFGVETAVLAVPGTRGVQVEVVQDPRWDPSMMTAEAREIAGIR